MRTFSRAIRVSVALAVVFSVGANQVSGSGPVPDRMPGLASSETLDGTVVAAGRMVDARGRGVAGRVTLVAWPPADVLANAQDGESVRLLPVGKAIAAADGSFSVRIDPSAPIGEFADSEGNINFDLLAESSSATGTLAFSGRLSSAAGSRANLASPGTAELSLTVPLGGPPPAPGVPEPAEDKLPVCVSTVKATWNGILNFIGEVYTGPNTNGDLRYLSGADSTVGVGYSVSGTYGSWSQSGTTTTSSTSEVGFPTQGVNKLTVFRSTFGWKKTQLVCAGQVSYSARPYQFQGGTYSYTASAAPSATYCTSYLDGSTYSKQGATAITISNGVKLGSVAGIDLSTRTGFNTETRISFTFVNNGKLCGSNGYPPQAARVVGK